MRDCANPPEDVRPETGGQPASVNDHDDPTTEVLIAGMAVADFVFRVPAIPAQAEKYRADSMEIVVGGPAANAAIAVARLGGRAILSTRLGEDEVADAIRNDLEAEGVDCRIRRGGRSPLSAVAVDAAGERQIVNFRGEALAEQPVTLDGLAPAAVLVDMGWTAAALDGLALARARGVPGVVDAETPATEAVLHAASHVAFPRGGLAAFTGIGDKEEALLAASRRLDGWVCVTDGADGVSYVAEGRVEAVPAFPVRAVDTLGAGDIWHGAFTLRLAEGAGEADAVRFANAVAALKCTGFGGGRASPARAAVERFLAEHDTRT